MVQFGRGAWPVEESRTLFIIASLESCPSMTVYTSNLNSLCSSHGVKEFGDTVWLNLVEAFCQVKDQVLPLSP